MSTALTRTIRGVVVTLLAVTTTACAPDQPTATGTVVDKDRTLATITQECSTVSAVPYMEDCQDVHRPDDCFVYLDTQQGLVQATVRCDAWDELTVGDQFTDGPLVYDSICARRDERGRWGLISAGEDCNAYS